MCVRSARVRGCGHLFGRKKRTAALVLNEHTESVDRQRSATAAVSNFAPLPPACVPDSTMVACCGCCRVQEAAGPFFYPFRVIRTLNIVSRSG